MLDKDFTWWGILGVILMSILGGLVKHMQTSWREKRQFFTKELAIDLLASLLIGLIVGLGCKGLGWDESVAGALGGVAGHMGSRFLIAISRAFEQRMKRWLNK